MSKTDTTRFSLELAGLVLVAVLDVALLPFHLGLQVLLGRRRRARMKSLLARCAAGRPAAGAP